MRRILAALAFIVVALENSAARIIHVRGWRRALMAFLSGVFSALAMAPAYIFPFIIIGFSTFILLLDGAQKQSRPLRSAFFVGWLFGFGYFLAGVYWMVFSFFVQADQFAWMAPIAVLAMPAFLALFSGVACLVAFRFWGDGWRRIFVFSAMWVIFEFLRGHILTGLPWNLAGQALAGTAIGSQTAAWYGAYGLSLATILISTAPAAFLGQNHPSHISMRGVIISVGALAALFFIGAVRLAAPEPAPNGENFLRIVQPNIPQREKIDPNMWADNFNRQLDLSTGPAPNDGRLFVIWPENGAPLLNEASTALSVLSQELPENAVLVAGAVRRDRDASGTQRFYNSIMVIAETPAGRAVVDVYDKHHLVPFGEYLPFYEILEKIGLAQLTPYGDAGFSPGPGPAILDVGGSIFAPLICYEVIFPGAIYPKGERPQWLLTVTNDAWFGDTSGPRQHLDQARLRAIESGLPMARSANTGISAVIDAKGRIISRVNLYQSGRIEAALPPALPRTLYDRTGDWIFFAMTAGILAAGLARGKIIAR